MKTCSIVKEEWKSLAKSCYQSYKDSKDRLLMIGFTTLIEYLNFLKVKGLFRTYSIKNNQHEEYKVL